MTDIQKGVKQFESRLNQDEKSIGLVVGKYDSSGRYIKAGEICLAINDSGESTATIEAKKIHLLGETIAQKISADYVKTKISQIASLTVQAVSGTTASFNNVYGGTIKFRSSSGSGYTYSDIKNVFVSSLKLTKDGNNYTLESYDANAHKTVVGTFSRAVASWDQSWSGGNFTAKAQPQNQSCWTAIAAGTASWSGRKVTIPIKAYNSNAPGTAVDTGYSVSATYTATKSDITASRGSRSASSPSSDASLTTITQNGYYLITVSACGATKTFVIRANVS